MYLISHIVTSVSPLSSAIWEINEANVIDFCLDSDLLELISCPVGKSYVAHRHVGESSPFVFYLSKKSLDF